MIYKFIKPFTDIKSKDLSLVGGKNYSLAEIIKQFTEQDIQVPNGFAITTVAYDYFITANKLEQKIPALLTNIDHEDLVDLRKTGSTIRQLIRDSEIPGEIAKEIIRAYELLSGNYGDHFTDVAVRSSSTAEDLPEASFAGQMESYLNVKGPSSVLDAVLNCFASLFTDRAISYRQQMGIDQFSNGISVGIQKMVRSDLGKSGVAFSLDTESGFDKVIQINASYGLGEHLVQGAVTPDEYLIFKPSLKKFPNPIIDKKLGAKESALIYNTSSGERTKEVKISPEKRDQFCLSDAQAIQLADWVSRIEQHYSQKHGKPVPVDVEWAIDGLSEQLFILQARPETVHSKKTGNTFFQYKLTQKSSIICTGIAVGDQIGQGSIEVLYTLDGRSEGIDPKNFKSGDVLVTEMTDPDWEPIMKKASAIITNKGGRTCHAAIIAREMGIPAIVGTGNATEILKTGDYITASCAEGETGRVYKGKLSFHKALLNLSNLPAIQTPVQLNVGNPEMAFHLAKIPCEGVGLAREEFIINNFIGIHPLALLQKDLLENDSLRQKINVAIKGYQSPESFFVERLAQGIAKIAAAFYPREVTVRFSDFKSNEYKNLLGGHLFEPEEENPMMGWRGASRYYSEDYRQAFGLECAAIKKVREEMGLMNVVPKIPFCRTVTECKEVIDVMSDFGLKRGVQNLKIYLMAEIPSNFILANDFAEYVDGFSIGSNDLTQLTLGLDRDSSLVAHIYDERNNAVKALIQSLIKTAHNKGKKVGICGQAPSDFPEFATFLVQNGIDTISVTPDAFFKTVKNIHNVETANRKNAA